MRYQKVKELASIDVWGKRRQASPQPWLKTFSGVPARLKCSLTSVLQDGLAFTIASEPTMLDRLERSRRLYQCEPRPDTLRRRDRRRPHCRDPVELQLVENDARTHSDPLRRRPYP